MIKKRAKRVAAISISLLVLILGFIFLIYFILLSRLSKNEMMTFEDEGQYYGSIQSAMKEKNEVDLQEIFKFDWESAYIVPTQRFSGSELSSRIGVDCDLLPLDPGAPAMRIVFYNKEKVVYDYQYDSLYLTFEPLDRIIPKESAVFIVAKKGKPIILQAKT